MGEEGEGSSSRHVYPAEVGYGPGLGPGPGPGPATPAKPDQFDLNMISKDWIDNRYDETFFDEASLTKSFGCCEDYSGSTSQVYDINCGMYNGFSMDDVDTWTNLSCIDLLALAVKKGSDGGAAAGDSSGVGVGVGVANETSMHFGDHDTQQCGWLNLGNYPTDLNLPPQPTTNSFQFMPVTPNQATRTEHQQTASDIVFSVLEGGTKLATDNYKEQSHGNVSTIVDTNQESEKGLTAETNVNETETPQPKQRRRKHRPKVIREGKPKKPRKSTTTPTPTSTPNPNGTSTGKRKYVRRKGIEKPTETPTMEEASGTIDPNTTDQKTKKSCKKKINFDELQEGTEVIDLTVEETCCVSQVVGTSETVLESHLLNPITPSKTEIPIKSAKRNSVKAKRKINLLQETHDKVASSVSNPNESNCSTSACFNKGGTEGSKKSNIGGMELWDENAIGGGGKSLEAFLSQFTDYNSGSNQSMQFLTPSFYTKFSLDGCQSSVTSGAISNDCIFLGEQKANKKPQRSKVNRSKQNSKNKRNKTLTLTHDSAPQVGMSKYGVTHQQQTYMEAHASSFQLSISTKKQVKKNSMVPSLYHGPRDFNAGYYGIDALVYQFGRLNINNQVVEENRDAIVPYMPRYDDKNALVLYQERGLVPYEGVFNPVKKRKPRPKVDLDDETSRVWRLLLENINNEGIDGTDEEKAKWWEEERRVFQGRADSFIARMHLVQGDRRFSRWKGSVLDSVVGVFLTQNVSDHLSSSAFMSLAARFPLKSNNSKEPLHEEPCQVDQDETIGWNEVKSNQPSEDHGPMMWQDTVNSNEFSKSSSRNIDLNVYSDCEVLESSEKDLAIYKELVVDDIVSSQNSASPSSVQSSERLGSCSKEEQKDGSKDTVLGGYSSFVELLHMQGSLQQTDESSNKKTVHEESESGAYYSNCSGALEVESFELRKETNIIQKKNEEQCASEESGLSAESASRTTVQIVKTANSQEVAIEKVSVENSKATESSNVVKTSLQSVNKVVEVNSVNHGTGQIVNGMNEGSSTIKKVKTGKGKQIQVEWDNLRLEAEDRVKEKREKTPNTSDSLDYEAVRNADVNEVADAIKERGMNNVLAARIKALLDRLVQDHGSIDLEWLRDVPPDKAKEYLLSFRGLGLKSVECVRLLTLHHLAFPVDTNVGRIAVRLGWVPLQPLPESLQLHLLELYPILESIQQYLWPRLCKLDQRTLYELHYQMITFGKVFCTKSKPNCNACPMRGECRHFASAFASARLALPAPEESMGGLTENRIGQSPIGMIEQRHLTLPPASEQPSEVRNSNPIIEEPATTGTVIEVPETPGIIVDTPKPPGTIVSLPETPGPIVEMPETSGPIIEVPATPEPEQIHHEEYDIEDFGEDGEEIPMIKLNIEEFTQNLQTYMEKHMVLGEGDLSKALVALTKEAASIPTPKLKNVSQLRTEHQVYELPDSHPLLEGLDTREPDDPCSYLLAIWTPGETADSVQPPEGQCSSQESGTLCNEETCFFCNSTREANSQTVRGTLLIPCRTATRGSFPLNGTYFQVNEVFADHASSLNPIDVPRSWLWNLPRRTVYFGTSIPTIFKGLTTEDIQYCFWRGFVCVRGFDQKTRAPRPLMARLHFPASKLKRSRPNTGGN